MTTLQAPPVVAKRRHSRGLNRSPQETPAKFLNYVVLAVTIVLAAFPIYWTFVVASSTEEETAKIPPSAIPRGNLGKNFHTVFNSDNVYFIKSLVNSLIVASVVTVSVLFFCSLAGFAFAKLRFKGRDPLMVLLIATLAVPTQIGIVALYILMSKMPSWLGGNWNGQLRAVIAPNLVTAFGVFYMRQFILEAVPDEIVEAARVDGASTIRIYWNVIAPAIRPAIGILGLFTFAAIWNDFQWPLITLTGDRITVQVALSRLASGQFVMYTQVLAGAFLATLPLLVVFFLAGKQIVAGIMEGAVKS
ncbi:MAG: carbohydrate ABC transporter permease [Actinomycetota bacterium]